MRLVRQLTRGRVSLFQLFDEWHLIVRVGPWHHVGARWARGRRRPDRGPYHMQTNRNGRAVSWMASRAVACGPVLLWQTKTTERRP